ncbi:Cleavage and polyadenylation specificity factor subunit 4, partial [Perkinsus olseni]
YDVNRMPECVAWVKHGRCTEKDCELRHDIETVECQKYKYGFCRLGNMCRLRHEKHGRQMLPDLVPDWYLRECVPNVFEYVPRMPEDLLRTSIQELKPNRDQSSGEINDTPEECNLLASVSGAWGAPGKQESGQGAASAWSAKPEAAEAGSGWGAPVRGRHGDEAQKSPSGWAALRHQAPANRSSGASWAAPQSKGGDERGRSDWSWNRADRSHRRRSLSRDRESHSSRSEHGRSSWGDARSWRESSSRGNLSRGWGAPMKEEERDSDRHSSRSGRDREGDRDRGHGRDHRERERRDRDRRPSDRDHRERSRERKRPRRDE